MGGGVFSEKSSDITVHRNSTVAFFNNNAEDMGGAIFSVENSMVAAYENSTLFFKNNRAQSQAGILLSSNTSFVIDANSDVIFINSIASKQKWSYKHLQLHFVHQRKFNSNV